MVCLLLDLSFLVAFVDFAIVLFGYLYVCPYMGLFSIVVFLGFPFVYWTLFSFYLDFILFGGLRSFEPWG